jgi:hypothetical protein
MGYSIRTGQPQQGVGHYSRKEKTTISNTEASNETIHVGFPSVSVQSFHFFSPCPDKSYYKQWADFWCHDHLYPSRVLFSCADLKPWLFRFKERNYHLAEKE